MSIAAMLLAAAAPPSAPPATIAPTGPWIVREDEDLCLLERSYPVGDGTATLIFQPLLDLPTMDLFVATSDRSDRQYQGTFTARIGADGPVFSGRYFSVWGATSKMRLTRLTVERAALDQLKDGDTLRVEAKPVDLTFRIGHPEKARVALQACVTGLKKSWGIDLETAKLVVSPLEGNPARYFDSSSYPPEALHKRIYGRVVALLNVAADGSVAHCRIVSSAGAALNDGTCKVAQRIRFKPARDKDGKPLASTYVLPVNWRLPGVPG